MLHDLILEEKSIDNVLQQVGANVFNEVIVEQDDNMKNGIEHKMQIKSMRDNTET